MRAVAFLFVAVILGACAVFADAAGPAPGVCSEGFQHESGGVCVPLNAAAKRTNADSGTP